MANTQTVLGRITQLAKANINALLDHAEDPAVMIDQLIRDYTNNIAQAEEAVAQTIGNLRLAEQDHAADLAAAADWGRKAAAASARADQMRATANLADAEKFDNLAKLALGKQINTEGSAAEAEPLIASQSLAVDKLKANLAAMKDKLTDLRTRRDSLVARQRTAEAQLRLQDAKSRVSAPDPSSEISRFEETVRRQEAYAAGQAEIARSSLEAQFAELGEPSESLEIEARLAVLKAGTPSPGGPSAAVDGGQGARPTLLDTEPRA